MHSDLTPDLALKRQSLEDFLSVGAAVAPLVAPPMPGTSIDPMMQAILDGVNDLRANTVTKATLREFHELQAEEMRTFVRAENAPLHHVVGQLSENVTNLARDSVTNFDRIGRVESRMDKLEQGGGSRDRPNKADVNHLRIAFKGFSSEGVDDRFETLKAFTEKYLGKNSFVCIDTRMTGDYKERKATGESFVQFGTQDARDRALDKLQANKQDQNAASSKGNKLTISKSKPEWVRQRDWAMRKSEELIQKKVDSRGSKATIKFEKGKESRKILVDGAEAFVQLRTDARGRFLNDFSDLNLP